MAKRALRPAAERPEPHSLVPAPRLRELLGITPVTLWRWRHDDKMDFPAAKVINGRLYYPWHEVAAWLDRQPASA